ncbi:MAG: hypothetical protein P8174_00815 [Gemmatimonadota bacterium]|jgi:hypothetical protein
MTALDDQVAQFSILAIKTAARELGMEPLTLARRLNQAEIARLIHLLNACLAHVDHPGLRHRTEDLLMAVTDGRMPDKRPESELDWALKVAKRRRSPADGQLDTNPDKEE